jgi:hypothetical protein
MMMMTTTTTMMMMIITDLQERSAALQGGSRHPPVLGREGWRGQRRTGRGEDRSIPRDRPASCEGGLGFTQQPRLVNPFTSTSFFW